ncbi:MAG: thioesterase family protein [Hyphomicrobiales bacterium]|nr:thioesterase family protein [Hyphomicrobiales bacterium]
MKDTLRPGLAHQFEFEVPESKTVPNLFPEADEFQTMPNVLATGFMVGLMEWTCVQLLAPHLDDGEGSLGVHVDVSHQAATPPGLTVTVDAECTDVRGPRAYFHIKAHDGIDLIGEGDHERFIVKWDRFNARVEEKRERVAV